MTDSVNFVSFSTECNRFKCLTPNWWIIQKKNNKNNIQMLSLSRYQWYLRIFFWINSCDFNPIPFFVFLLLNHVPQLKQCQWIFNTQLFIVQLPLLSNGIIIQSIEMKEKKIQNIDKNQ